MRILTIAATQMEIEGIRSQLPKDYHHEVDFKVTGIGIVATTFNLTKIFSNESYDLVLQIGIGGSFDPDLPPGTVCQVRSEIFGDSGSEDKDGSLLNLFELGLMDAKEIPFENAVLQNETFVEIPDLILVKGSTVNKTLGSKQSIEHFIAKYPDVQIESLEGAALFYVCKSLNIKFLELRAISNMVEPRSRESWDIPLALRRLSEMYLRVLNDL